MMLSHSSLHLAVQIDTLHEIVPIIHDLRGEVGSALNGISMLASSVYHRIIESQTSKTCRQSHQLHFVIIQNVFHYYRQAFVVNSILQWLHVVTSSWHGLLDEVPCSLDLDTACTYGLNSHADFES